MNLANFLPGLNKAADPDAPLTEEQLREERLAKQARAPKNGPVKMRSVSSGQIRRAQARWEASQKRKANRRFRRDWMRNEAAFNRLRCQLLVVTTTPDHASAASIRKALEGSYGSVDDARLHYDNLVADRTS